MGGPPAETEPFLSFQWHREGRLPNGMAAGVPLGCTGMARGLFKGQRWGWALPGGGEAGLSYLRQAWWSEDMMPPGPMSPGKGRGEGAGQEVGPVLRCLLDYPAFSTLSSTVQVYLFPPNSLFPGLFLFHTSLPRPKAIRTPEWPQPNFGNTGFFSPHSKLSNLSLPLPFSLTLCVLCALTTTVTFLSCPFSLFSTHQQESQKSIAVGVTPRCTLLQ